MDCFFESSSEEASYRSSKSVASVMKLCLVQGADDGAGELVSVSDEDVDGQIGAERKWFPLGVGKWSLKGDRCHDAKELLGDLSWGDLFRPLSICIFVAKLEPRWDSSSTSIIVLSEGRLLGTCPDVDAGRYTVDGKNSKEAIFNDFGGGCVVN